MDDIDTLDDAVKRIEELEAGNAGLLSRLGDLARKAKDTYRIARIGSWASGSDLSYLEMVVAHHADDGRHVEDESDTLDDAMKRIDELDTALTAALGRLDTHRNDSDARARQVADYRLQVRNLQAAVKGHTSTIDVLTKALEVATAALVSASDRAETIKETLLEVIQLGSNRTTMDLRVATGGLRVTDCKVEPMTVKFTGGEDE